MRSHLVGFLKRGLTAMVAAAAAARNPALTLGGAALAINGVRLEFGNGWAFIIGGLALFTLGELGSALKART